MLSGWRLRAVLAVVAVAMLTLSSYLGYVQELSAEDAQELVRAIEEAEKELISSGSAPEVALRLFTLEAPVLLTCNLPGVGPALAVYLTYEAGRYAKALEVVGSTEAYKPLGPSDAIRLTVLSVAFAESMYLTAVLLRRERWEALETAALVVLELSLIALVSAIEATSL
ncbi:MAG: hypothetical protein QXM99_04975 [Thermofilum sp.]